MFKAVYFTHSVNRFKKGMYPNVPPPAIGKK